MRRTLYLLLLICSLPAGGAAESLDVRYLNGLGDTHYLHMQSRHTGRPYHIYAMVPPGHGTDDALLPAIYLLDGGGLFPMLAAYHRYLRLGDEVPPAIVVGISYGSDNFEGGNYRSTDYTAPSSERDYWGGAAAFQSFLADELLPRIETDFRADPAQRHLFGHSLGGQFVLYSAQTRPGLFAAHLASNPALHRNLPFFLQARPVSARDGSTRLFVGSGDRDDARFMGPRQQWAAHWNGIADKRFKLEVRNYAGHSHFSTPPAVLRDGLRWVSGAQ